MFNQQYYEKYCHVFDINSRFLTETDVINDRSLLNIDDVSGDINQIFQLKMRLNKEWAPILDLIRESELFAKLPGEYNFNFSPDSYPPGIDPSQ